MPKPFSTLPFFRLLLPYISGVLLAMYVGSIVSWYWLSLPLAAVLLVSMPVYKFKRIAVLLAVDSFLLCFGNLQTGSLSTYAGAGDTEPQHLLVQLLDVPVEKQKTFKYEARVLQVSDTAAADIVKQTVYLYFRKCSKALSLKAGTTVQVHTILKTPALVMNPNEFNYRRYLWQKHILYTGFVDSLSFATDTLYKSSQSLWLMAVAAKSTVLDKLKHAGLTQDAYAICAALLSGYDDDVDKEIVTAFAKSGTLHILSVSGLHTGLVYALLAWVFAKIDPNRRYRIIEFFVTALLLWSFAFFTGLAPPVVRAVLMFSFLGVGRLFFRTGARNQLNILALSAFCILAYDPFLLFDLGFLLSYGAMFGLLFFTPRFTRLYPSANRIQKLILDSTSASVAATIPTLPLSLVVFKQFPIWFVFANLIVVPVSFFLLLAGFLIAMGFSILVPLVNFVTQYLVKFILLFSSHKGMVIEQIDFIWSDALLLSVLILLATWAITQNRAIAALLSLSLLVVWQVTALVQSFGSKSSEKITFYSMRKSEGTSVKAKQAVYYHITDSAAFQFSMLPQLCAFNNAGLEDTLFNSITSPAGSIVILRKEEAAKVIPINFCKILVLAPGCYINQQVLKNCKALQLLIVVGPRSKKQMRFIGNLCRNFSIKMYATATLGACVLKVNDTIYEIENWR